MSWPTLKRSSCCCSTAPALSSGVIIEEPTNQKSSGVILEGPSNQKRRRLTDAIATTEDVAPSPRRSSSSGWSDLPQDISSTILKKLTLLADYDRFGSVCASWRRASLEIPNRNLRMESKIRGDGLPLLLLPSDRLVSEEDKSHADEFKTDCNPWKRTLFDVFRQTTVTDNFYLPPVPKSVGRCCGSSHGWLIFADRYQNVVLVNPFYIGGGPSCGRGIVHLPPLAGDGKDDELDRHLKTASRSYVPELHVNKVVLSADPALFPNDYVVVAVAMAKYFAFIRPGTDKNWTKMALMRTGKPTLNIQDVLFSSRRNTIIYAVEGRGTIYYCKTTDPMPKLRKLSPPPHLLYSEPALRQFYLVELSSPQKGEILSLVCRLLERGGIATTTRFRVFKLLSPGGRLTAWCEMKNLGGSNKALFVGENRSTCVDISAASHNIQQNSIYFTDDRLVAEGGVEPFLPYKDMGIFNMENQTIQRYYDVHQLSQLVCIPPPIWFFPSLPGNWK